MPVFLFNKIVGVRPATLLKKRLWHRGFPVNFAKFIRTSFLTEHFQWLFLSFFSSISDIIFLLLELKFVVLCFYLMENNKQSSSSQVVQFYHYQKQPPEVLCEKRCSEKFHKIHCKTPFLFFNKVAGLGLPI